MKRFWAVPSLALAAFLAVSVVPAGAQTASGTTVSVTSDALEISGTPAPVSVTSNLKLFPSLAPEPTPASKMASDDSFHKFDVFVGYSFLNNNTAFVDTLGDEPVQLVHGYAASVKFNLSRNFGILADFSGHNGSLNQFGVHQNEDQYYFLIGPEVSHSFGKARISGHALVGAAKGHYGDSSGGETIDHVIDHNFSAGVGGSFDWMFTDRWGWRVLQFDYLTSIFDGVRVNNVRGSTGFVVRFK